MAAPMNHNIFLIFIIFALACPCCFEDRQKILQTDKSLVADHGQLASDCSTEDCSSTKWPGEDVLTVPGDTLQTLDLHNEWSEEEAVLGIDDDEADADMGDSDHDIHLAGENNDDADAITEPEGALYDSNMGQNWEDYMNEMENEDEFVQKWKRLQEEGGAVPTKSDYIRVNGQNSAFTFKDVFLLYKQCPVKPRYLYSLDLQSQATRSEKTRKVKCIARNVTKDSNETFEVQILNNTSLMTYLAQNNTNTCAVVLFYAPWCTFCAEFAPHYHAVARIFTQLHILALDAAHFSHLNGRFGTIAVPNIIVFHNAKPITRFNSTSRTLESIAHFLSNVTGFAPTQNLTLLESDYEGPLPTTPEEQTDYLLGLSWLFTLVFVFIMFKRSETGKRVIHVLATFGRDQPAHEHID